MTRLARKFVKFLAILVLLWADAMFASTALYLTVPLLKSRNALAAIIAFAAGTVVFSFYKLRPLYIFAHETTHLMVAKLFLKDTGRMQLGKTQGYVDVRDINVWIALAPYIIPFYALVAMGMFGLTQIFVYPPPWWGTLAFACAVGLSYAYHLVLTIYALRRAQSDLELYGNVFSLSLIVCGNISIVLLAILMATSKWSAAWAFISRLCAWQAHGVVRLCNIIF